MIQPSIHPSSFYPSTNLSYIHPSKYPHIPLFMYLNIPYLSTHLPLHPFINTSPTHLPTKTLTLHSLPLVSQQPIRLVSAFMEACMPSKRPSWFWHYFPFLSHGNRSQRAASDSTALLCPAPQCLWASVSLLSLSLVAASPVWSSWMWAMLIGQVSCVVLLLIGGTWGKDPASWKLR